MITKTAPALQRSIEIREQIPAKKDWQTALAEAIRDPHELLRQLQLSDSSLAHKLSDTSFPLRVTHSFIQRMQPGDPDDPLLRQVLPTRAESLDPEWGRLDPVGDQAAMREAGLIHKYAGRVLLVSTAACAIHCRYCFRQHFPYQQANPLGSQWPASLAYLKSQTDIHEVILSGGDPLSLTDERLTRLISQLDQVPQLQTLRIHTRLPVVLPQRITTQLLEWIHNTRLSVVFVLHINHPNEINQELVDALRPLQNAGVILLNQAVLLREINDTPEALIQLSHKLFAAGILPYYLHQLDRVRGAAHFEVSEQRGRDLLDSMRQALPGYLVPKYVKEIPGNAAKSPIFG
ncbi:MAG: EF-P beta-lysylation protein EpmB [Thioalkalispiraceae bacterium]|jgi:EF-P beta-lysylation protein EpmB